MKKAKIPQKRIVAMLKMMFYINTHNVKQQKALDKSAGHLTLIYYCMRLVAPNKEPALAEEKLNQTLRIIPDANQTNVIKFSYDKGFAMWIF